MDLIKHIYHLKPLNRDVIWKVKEYNIEGEWRSVYETN